VGGGAELNTEYKTIPMVPKAITNKTYAVINAPRPNTLRPLESDGESSIPIITESEPVPNGSPNIIRLQNSIVAHANGNRPAINTHTSTFCKNDAGDVVDSVAAITLVVNVDDISPSNIKFKEEEEEEEEYDAEEDDGVVVVVVVGYLLETDDEVNLPMMFLLHDDVGQWNPRDTCKNTRNIPSMNFMFVTVVCNLIYQRKIEFDVDDNKVSCADEGNDSIF
jgi:hypothetical protein